MSSFFSKLIDDIPPSTSPCSKAVLSSVVYLIVEMNPIPRVIVALTRGIPRLDLPARDFLLEVRFLFAIFLAISRSLWSQSLPDVYPLQPQPQPQACTSLSFQRGCSLFG